MAAEPLLIRAGDEIVTRDGKRHTVGEVVAQNGQAMILPAGCCDPAQLIPASTVVDIIHPPGETNGR